MTRSLDDWLPAPTSEMNSGVSKYTENFIICWTVVGREYLEWVDQQYVLVSNFQDLMTSTVDRNQIFHR